MAVEATGYHIVPAKHLDVECESDDLHFIIYGMIASFIAYVEHGIKPGPGV